MSGDAAPALASQRFRAEREASWRALEALLDVAEKRSARALSDADLAALPGLYRATLSALSVARATSLDGDLVGYLESLSARAYFFVYGVRGGGWRRIIGFFRREWPAAAAALAAETLVSALLMAAGVLVGYLLVSGDPAWFAAFVPADLAGGRDFQASAASLQKTLGGGQSALAIMSAFLFTHNAQIAIAAFALGFAFGVPTALLLIYTGCMVGAFFALFVARGLGIELGGWLMIHGTTELLAVIIAGAAGLRIGRAMVFPGRLPRLAAAQAAGRLAATAMIGVVLMLLVAGLLEGFARQLVTDTVLRYAIAGLMLTGWLTYLYLPRAAR